MARMPGFIKRAPRIDLRRPAVLIDGQGTETEVVVTDISSGGFRLEVSEMPRIGEHVTLRTDAGQDFPVQIRWALNNEAGGVFLTKVDYSVWD
jgi:hypothetical protein